MTIMGTSMSACAQIASKTQAAQPIEVSSDKLDVFQDQNKAVFTGNVIAVQGSSNLRSKEMTVFYRQNGGKKADATDAAVKAAAKPADGAPPGIYRIEAQGDVVYTTPTEAATGDTGIYDVDKNTIDILGSSVILTRGQNVLKGNRLNYNLGTGRSILTAGGGSSDVTGASAGKRRRFIGEPL